MTSRPALTSEAALPERHTACCGERRGVYSTGLGPPLIRPCKNLCSLSLLRAPPPTLFTIAAHALTASAFSLAAAALTLAAAALALALATAALATAAPGLAPTLAAAAFAL